MAGRPATGSKPTPMAMLTRGTKGGRAVGIVLIVILVLILVGSLPTWPYSSGWGPYPSGGAGLILLVLIILLLTGRL